MYRFECNWNRKLAMRGEGTAAAIVEMIRGMATGNFVGLDCNMPAPTRLRRFKYGTHGAWPSLDTLLQADIAFAPCEIADKAIGGFVQDETGRLSWSVWLVSDTVRPLEVTSC